MTFVSIARLSKRNSAGKVSFARMPPTFAAARIITSGFCSARHLRTASCSRRSRSLRRTVRSSTSSRSRRRTIADPTMPRWPATQTRRFFPAESIARSNPPALFHDGNIACHHFRNELRECNRMLPAKLFCRFRRIAEKDIDLSWTEIARIDFDKDAAALLIDPFLVHSRALPGDRKSNFGEGPLHELAHGMRFPGREHIIVRLRLLQNTPHPLDIVARMPPVPASVKIAEKELALQAQVNSGNAPGDLARHEGFRARWPFVIEQDAVRCVNAISFAVIYGNPISVKLRRAVRRAGIKRRLFVLRNGLHFAVKLGCGGLIEARLLAKAEDADRFQEPQGAERIGIGCVFRGLEAHLHMALGGQIVDLVGLNLLDDPDEIGRVGEVAVMQQEIHPGLMRILI